MDEDPVDPTGGARRRGAAMNDLEPIDGVSGLRRRDLFGFLLLALAAGLMIVVAVVMGGGVDD